jgi:CubicO group peptidase (beta-lactamase class C family)
MKRTFPLLAGAVLAIALLAGAPATRAADEVLGSAAPAAVGFAPERLARIDEFINAQIAARQKAGAVVLLARRGKIAYFKAYGSAELASGRPMQTSDYFRLWSMTKPVTSVALLTLYEQGKFRLSDRLDRYLPAFKTVRVYAGTNAQGEAIYEEPKRAITIQDVMRHTAGFVYSYFDNTPVDAAYRAAGIDYVKMDSARDLTDKIATMPLLYQPGTRWVYSFSHDVQAYLVEYFSGMSFDAYCRKVIFEPLGMKDTFFGAPPERRARFAETYMAAPDGGLTVTSLAGEKEDVYRHFTDHPFGGAGLSSTPLDYLRFAQMLLNGGELGHARILGRKTVELMTSDNLPPGVGSGDAGFGYGLGVWVLNNPALSGNLGSVGQFGWGGIATTYVVIDPKEQLVALLFAQYTPTDHRFIDPWVTLVYQALVP